MSPILSPPIHPLILLDTASTSTYPASSSLLAGTTFIVVGAGGAGKTLMKDIKKELEVANRTYEKAKELANKVGGQALSLAKLNDFYPEEGMILVHATPVGMVPRTMRH